MSHSQQNQHDNAEPCSQDYTHGGNNGTYGHKEYSSFFKTVYCLRTKQTTSKYIWHQHLTVLQADPSFQNPKKKKKTCTCEYPINFAGAHDEPGHFLEEEVNSCIVLLTPGCSSRAKWLHPTSLLPFHAASGTLSLGKMGLGMGCLCHSSCWVHPIPCSDLSRAWGGGQLGAG